MAWLALLALAACISALGDDAVNAAAGEAWLCEDALDTDAACTQAFPREAGDELSALQVKLDIETGSQRTATAPAPAPAPSSSVALVKVTEENSMTTASVLGGLAGLLVGGVWVGGALFAASSYLARKKDNDVAAALKGVASGSLEALNFSAYVNDKYTVTGKVGDAISKALEKQKAEGGDAVDSITKFTDAVSEAFVSLDKDVGIKDTLGSLATSASELAAQAVDKAIELNDQYKITDQIKEKIEESTKKA
mmetsp:Transcript_55223/g.142229  ORF Transcript_55223/g.142229 Transcript_55223/m.142229 type:complete len:252 (-) Transcript_55223:153-908(-)